MNISVTACIIYSLMCVTCFADDVAVFPIVPNVSQDGSGQVIIHQGNTSYGQGWNVSHMPEYTIIQTQPGVKKFEYKGQTTIDNRK